MSLNRIGKENMASTIIDDYKIFPRIMMLVVTILTYQATHWFMSLPDPTNSQSAFVSVIVGAGAAWFGLYVGKK